MSSHHTLTQDDVLIIAKLACLYLNNEEVERFRKQLDQTVSYIENLDELDTQNIRPTSHSTQVVNVFFEDDTENTRQLSSIDALKNARKTSDGRFVVPRIM